MRPRWKSSHKSGIIQMMGKELGWVEVLNGDWAGPLCLRVHGRSMWPTLRPGDQVTVEPASPSDLQTGDVHQVLCHRASLFDGYIRAGITAVLGELDARTHRLITSRDVNIVNSDRVASHSLERNAAKLTHLYLLQY